MVRTTLTTTLRGSIGCAIKRNVIFQHEVEDRQHLMCYRDYGALLAASRRQFAKPRLEYASRLSSR
jgi:hypothetical protein